MLNIVKGGFYSSSHTDAVERIRERICASERSLLIVPEQQTVLSEGSLARSLPDSAPLFFEVTNFTRLANSAFRALGGIGGEYCDRGKRALIMWRTLTELSPSLSMTKGSNEITVAAVERALGAVGEMQSLGISPEALEAVLSGGELDGDKRLSDKLFDLVSIYSLYKDTLSERYTDAADDVSALVKMLSENSEYLSDTEIFIEGFTSFTEPQYALIEKLSERCSVTVYLTLSLLREDAFEYSEIKKCEERLKSFARLGTVSVRLTRNRALREGVSPTLSEIAELLWFKTYENENITLQNPEELRIVKAPTPYAEASFVASDIRRRVMAGARYSDFAVVTASLSDYDGILDTALTRAGVPSFSSRKRDVSSFELIKLIYTAFSAVRSGFRREDVLTYAKCGLSGLSRDACDELEMYVNKWQISGKRFTDGIAWNMNPEGFSTHRGRGTDEKLVRINSAREQLIRPLVLFKEATETAGTVREHATALLELLLSLNCEEKLAERADSLEALGEFEAADANRKLWGLVSDVLDSFVEVSGELPASPEAFLSQLKILFSTAEVGRIPAFRDSVTLGSADMLRLYTKKHIYIIGVTDGNFPRQTSDDSYFNESDKARLHSLGLSIEPTLEIDGARELYSFSRAFSYAESSITLLYSTANTRFKATSPSEVIGRIIKITGGSVRIIDTERLSAEDRLYSSSDALSDAMSFEPEKYPSLREALISSGAEAALLASEGGLENTALSLSKSLAGKIYGKEQALTQSRLDSYRSCPLAHFCRYTVKLSREERAEFDAPGIGTFIHAILENFFSLLHTEGRRPGELSEEEKHSLTRRAAKKYISALGEDTTESQPEVRVKLDRLCRAAIPVVDGLCEEFSESEFEPRFFELAITRDKEDSPSPVGFKTESGDSIYVYGVIDRVDTYKKGEDVYVRVVDYKTGKKSFSPSDLDEGKNLQMFLYLQSILKTESDAFKERLGVTGKGRIIPAGVIYVKTDVSDKTVPRPDDALAREAVMEAQARQGMVLYDEEIISAMGLRHTPLYSARSKDKIPDSKKELLFTEESFEELLEKVGKRVISAAEGMKSGRLDATPSKTEGGVYACAYCEYKPICRFVKTK
ncbi:MAG: PD-(D/E)XK nuclease family protein [Clostridia bacterium]|nr:PD-(D/E)XK nuclease family protein [Clostridia bacterium]